MDMYDLTITLPSLSGGKKWYRVADTAFDSPDDIVEKGSEELLPEQKRYVLIAGATAILMSK
jgi:glycogen operon protein